MNKQTKALHWGREVTIFLGGYHIFFNMANLYFKVTILHN